MFYKLLTKLEAAYRMNGNAKSQGKLLKPVWDFVKLSYDQSQLS